TKFVKRLKPAYVNQDFSSQRRLFLWQMVVKAQAICLHDILKDSVLMLRCMTPWVELSWQTMEFRMIKVSRSLKEPVTRVYISFVKKNETRPSHRHMEQVR